MPVSWVIPATHRAAELRRARWHAVERHLQRVMLVGRKPLGDLAWELHPLQLLLAAGSPRT